MQYKRSLMCGLLLPLLLSISIFELSAQSDRIFQTGYPLFKDYLRRSQVTAQTDQRNAFFYSTSYLSGAYLDSLDESLLTVHKLIGTKHYIGLLPLQMRFQFNSQQPYSRNDGSLMPVRGAQSLISGSLVGKLGPLSFRFAPEILLAQSKPFNSFNSDISGINRIYYRSLINRFESPPFVDIDPYQLLLGQSAVYVDIFFNRLALSTENLWIGPGRRNSIQFTNNAPGFLHYRMNSNRSIDVGIGSIEYLIAAGFPSSGNVSFTPDSAAAPFYRSPPDNERFMSIISASFSPHFIKGLSFGFIRSVQSYIQDLGGSYFDGFTGFFRPDAQFDRSDQMASIYLRWVFEDIQTEFYSEYARNDAAFNGRDFLQQPDHSAGYLFGLAKYIPIGKRTLEIAVEYLNLERSGHFIFRAEPSFYSNVNLLQGHTNQSQFMGAALLPGSSSIYSGIFMHKGYNSFGLSFERVVNNQDFYYSIILPEENNQHWIDYHLQFNLSRKMNVITIDGEVNYTYSKNHQWSNLVINNPIDPNLSNLHLSLNCLYNF